MGIAAIVVIGDWDKRGLSKRSLLAFSQVPGAGQNINIGLSWGYVTQEVAIADRY
jgi:hypothetical protein